MNVQEKIAAIERHATKALIEIRELQIYLGTKPTRVVSFPGRSRAQGSGYVSAADESVDWPDDAA